MTATPLFCLHQYGAGSWAGQEDLKGVKKINW